MSDSILHSFLNNRFIKTDDPDHIKNLEKISDAVQKLLKYKKNKPKIIAYTLVALDPTISDDDPVVKEVDALIIKQWSTFRNSVVKTKDTPTSYIQAVILDALDKLSKDENFAAIVWHTGCKIISHYKLARQEEVLTRFLLDIGKKVEEVGRNDWNILESAKIDIIDPIKLTLPEIDQGEVEEGELKKHLIAAAVHSGWASQAGGGENPHSQGQNTWQWPHFLAERAAKGLAEEINGALFIQNETLTSAVNSIQEAIDSYIKSHSEQVSFSKFQNPQSFNNRSDLLWWKQSLYSPRLDSSYRTLSPLAMAIAMAVDLANNVSPIHPKSVDYFLKETLRDVLGDESDEKFAVVKLLEQLQQLPDDEKRLLEDLYNENEGRKSLGSCMAGIIKEKVNPQEFFYYTGLEKKTKISLGELTVWLFHDLQANTLVNTK